METSFSKRTSLLVTIPFILFGIEWLFETLRFDSFEPFLMFIPVVSMFVVMGAGWINGFPRWSFPAIGGCVLMSCYFMNVSMPVISRDLSGLWAWLPFVIMAVICIIIKPSIDPFKQLFATIKQRPGLLLLILYGILPLVATGVFDEVHSLWLVPVIIIITLVLAGGLYYLLKTISLNKRT
jgi:hypothetical protein